MDYKIFGKMNKTNQPKTLVTRGANEFSQLDTNFVLLT